MIRVLLWDQNCLAYLAVISTRLGPGFRGSQSVGQMSKINNESQGVKDPEVYTFYIRN